MPTKKDKCTTMATLRKRCAGGPLIPQVSHGLVRFMTLVWNIKAFRYNVHDVAKKSGISVTDEGRKLIAEFHAKIQYDPMKLLTISEAAEVVERSRPYWFSTEQ